MLIEGLRGLLRRKFVQDTIILQIAKIGIVGLGALSTILVSRLMGPALFGVFGLADSFLSLWRTLDFTGIGMSTNTRLALAVGARDEEAAHRLMAFYVQVSMAMTVGLALLIALLGPPLAGAIQGDPHIGRLAAILALAGPADAFYGLVVIALQARRSMRSLALLQNARQFILTSSLIIAVLISPTPESLVLARLIYAYVAMAAALLYYARRRSADGFTYPTMRAVVARAPRISPRPYWRFSVANAVDKNIADLFIHVPLQLVGAAGGETAAGYLSLALRGLNQAAFFTSAVFENMQAVVPQTVGRGAYADLWRNFRRVLFVLLIGGALFYGAIALAAPLVVPSLFGEAWIPAVAVVVPLTIYGAITTAGGIFGPLYRTFGLMKQAILVKFAAVSVVALLGLLIVPGLTDASAAAIAGAWMINIVFLLSTASTAAFTLPILRSKARAQTDG